MSSRRLLRALSSMMLGITWLMAGLPVQADTQLDAAVLKKVKAATVHLEVTLANGDTVEGSGFFTDEPGVLLTNAHVLCMLDADSRPPQKIIATVNSGETNSRALTGKLLGVDRGSDLAVLRVEGKDVPEALKVVPAKELTETQEVFIFGFPLGKRLGKNITISKSSVSSLRKDKGVLKQIQVNGGMHPGNSGGPVVDGKGQVVGVSVSIITGTQLHFAIPGETVHTFLNGRIDSLGADLGYKDGDKIKMGFRLVAIDPLGRIKNIKMETWTGEPGTRRRTGGAPPLPTDSPRETVEIKYEKQQVTSLELSLPMKEDAKKVYWMQPTYTNGANKTIYYMAWAPTLGTPVERKDITLRYQPRLGRTQLTDLTSEGTFRVIVGTVEHSVAMNSKSTLIEKTAAQKAGDAVPIHLNYKAFTLTVLEDKKPITDNALLKRDIGNIGAMSADVDMAADGNAARVKDDLTKVPKVSRDFLKDVSDQVLQSVELVTIPLPKDTIKPLQTWNVQRNILVGNSLIGVQALSDIKFIYLGTRMLKDREIAFLSVRGTVKGLRGAGLDVGGTVTGTAQVALDTGEVLTSTMTFKADADLETKSGKAKLAGTLMVKVVRNVPPPAKPPEKPKGN